MYGKPKTTNYSIHKPGTVMYIIGGGNKLPHYMKEKGQIRSTAFCKKVKVLEDNIGGHLRKTYVI